MRIKSSVSDSLSHMMSPETHSYSEDTGDLIFTVPVLILQAGLLGRKAFDDLSKSFHLHSVTKHHLLLLMHRTEVEAMPRRI